MAGVPRERTRESSESQDWGWMNTTCSGAHGAVPSIDSDSGTNVIKTKSEVMNDVVTSEYKRLSGEGHIINNPYTKVTTISQESIGSYYYVYKWDVWNAGCVPGGEQHTYTSANFGEKPASTFLPGGLPDVPAYDPSSLIDLAVGKAWAKINVSDVQSLVMVGEAEKTVKGLYGMFRRLIKIIKMIKRVDAKGLWRELSAKEIQNRYMELRYALRPLLYDAKGCAAAINTVSSSKPVRATFRGSAKYHDEGYDTDVDLISNTNFFGGGYGYRSTSKTEWYHNVEVRAGVLTAIDELNALNIWGVTQPIESLWELVPLSFVVDWIINVGEVISAWTPNYGIQSLASWYTMKDVVYRRRSLELDDSWWSGSNPPYTWNEYAHTLNNCFIDQTVITTTRVPNPSRSLIPNFNIRLNEFKLIDLVIIAKQLAGR